MKWPLAVSSFTTLDKLKVGWWLLKEDHWSQGEFVRRYEETWESYTGCKHAIMVSSGSAANFLMAQRRKYELEKEGLWPERNRVVFPVVNWISAVSPWIQQGFEPIFMDVSGNLCSSSDQVARALESENVAAVCYTTLLGFSGVLENIKGLCERKGVPLYVDNCESSFSWEGNTHFCNFATSSTSFYFSHHTSGNQEGGMVFCEDDDEACWYRMARNHGMTRGMPERYKNPKAHPSFDFYTLGSNHRSTNLIAYMASLDFKRSERFSETRKKISAMFTHGLNRKLYEQPHIGIRGEAPFSIPIVCKEEGIIELVKGRLTELGIEHRPIVGGNLLRHTAFRLYGSAGLYPRAEHIHDNGLYLGLHRKVTVGMAEEMVTVLNTV